MNTIVIGTAPTGADNALEYWAKITTGGQSPSSYYVKVIPVSGTEYSVAATVYNPYAFTNGDSTWAVAGDGSLTLKEEDLFNGVGRIITFSNNKGAVLLPGGVPNDDNGTYLVTLTQGGLDTVKLSINDAGTEGQINDDVYGLTQTIGMSSMPDSTFWPMFFGGTGDTNVVFVHDAAKTPFWDLDAGEVTKDDNAGLSEGLYSIYLNPLDSSYYAVAVNTVESSAATGQVLTPTLSGQPIKLAASTSTWFSSNSGFPDGSVVAMIDGGADGGGFSVATTNSGFTVDYAGLSLGGSEKLVIKLVSANGGESYSYTSTALTGTAKTVTFAEIPKVGASTFFSAATVNNTDAWKVAFFIDEDSDSAIDTTPSPGESVIFKSLTFSTSGTAGTASPNPLQNPIMGTEYPSTWFDSNSGYTPPNAPVGPTFDYAATYTLSVTSGLLTVGGFPAAAEGDILIVALNDGTKVYSLSTALTAGDTTKGVALGALVAPDTHPLATDFSTPSAGDEWEIMVWVSEDGDALLDPSSSGESATRKVLTFADSPPASVAEISTTAIPATVSIGEGTADNFADFDLLEDTSGGQTTGGDLTISADPVDGLIIGFPAGRDGDTLQVSLTPYVTTPAVLDSVVISGGATNRVTYSIAELETLIDGSISAAADSPIKIFAWFEKDSANDAQDVGEGFVTASLDVSDEGVLTVTSTDWIDLGVSNEFVAPVTLALSEPAGQQLDLNAATDDLIVPGAIGYTVNGLIASEDAVLKLTVVDGLGGKTNFDVPIAGSSATSLSGTLELDLNGIYDVSAQVFYGDGVKTLPSSEESFSVFRGPPTIVAVDLVDGDGTNTAPAGQYWYRVKLDRGVLDFDAQDIDQWDHVDASSVVPTSDPSVWVIKQAVPAIGLALRDGAEVISQAFGTEFGLASADETGATVYATKAGTATVSIFRKGANYDIVDVDELSVVETLTYTFTVAGSQTEAFGEFQPTVDTDYYFDVEFVPADGSSVDFDFNGSWVQYGSSLSDAATLSGGTVAVTYDTTDAWLAWGNFNVDDVEWGGTRVPGGYSLDVDGHPIETTTIYYDGVQAILQNAAAFVPPQFASASYFYGLEGNVSDPMLDSKETILTANAVDTAYLGDGNEGGVDTLDATNLPGSAVINLQYNWYTSHNADGSAGRYGDLGEFDTVIVGGAGNTIVGANDVSETFVIVDDTRDVEGDEAVNPNTIYGGESSYDYLDAQIVDQSIAIVGTGNNAVVKVTVDIQGEVSRWLGMMPDAYKGITVSSGASQANSVGVSHLKQIPVGFDAPVGLSRWELTLEANATSVLTGLTAQSVLNVEMGPDNVFLKRAETDVVDYSQLASGQGVSARLGHDGQFEDSGVLGGDILVDIEGVIGSDYDDAIRGNDETNVLFGGLGGDRLSGQGGADILVGGAGFDHLQGGTGNDLLVDLDGGALLSGAGATVDYVTLNVAPVDGGSTITVVKTGIGASFAIGDFVNITGKFTAEDIGGLSPSDLMQGILEITDKTSDSITVAFSGTATGPATYGSSAGESAYLSYSSGHEDDEKNIFIVGGGRAAGDPQATITDFQFSQNNAGLTGRALEFSSDKIGLNISAVMNATVFASLAAEALTQGVDIFDVAADWIRANVGVDWRPILDGESNPTGDIEVYAFSKTGYFVDGNNDPLENQTFASAIIKGADAALGAGMQASVVRLDEVEAMEWQVPMGLTYSSVDVNAVVGAAAEWSVDEAQMSTVFFALEATRIGTVRGENKDVDGGVMQGRLDQQPAIFNPGHGDQRMVGQSDSDTYEFITQDFSSVFPTSASRAGNDRIFDLGGAEDSLVFSDATIEDLHVHAVRTGRDIAANSLRIEYSQESDSGIVNDGSVYWEGHYQLSGRFALETITVSNGASGYENYQVGRDIVDGLTAIGVELSIGDGYDGAIMAGQRKGDLFNIMWDGNSAKKVYISDFDHGADHLLFSQGSSGSLTPSGWNVTSSGGGGLNVNNGSHLLEIILMDGGSINPEDVLTTLPM